MRAVVCTGYGPPDVLRLRDVAKPVPKGNELLVRIRATTVSTADCELRKFDFAPWIWLPLRLAFGIIRPRQPVLGQELAGDVESVGEDVRCLRKGDRVFAATGIGLGAYAEYLCLRENPTTGRSRRCRLAWAMRRQPPYRTGARGTAIPANRRRPEWTQGPGQRRGRQLRHVRSPTRKGPRGSRDRGGQCVKAGDASLDRRGPRHRLRPGGLHRQP